MISRSSKFLKIEFLEIVLIPIIEGSAGLKNLMDTQHEYWRLKIRSIGLLCHSLMNNDE